MHKIVCISLLLVCGAMSAMAAPVGNPMGIEAVIGEDAISSYDVNNRLRFIMATTRLSNTPDVMSRIRPQVIRSLIDERLQIKEAAKNGITVEEAEVEEAIQNIERQRNMPAGTAMRVLAQNNIPKDTFYSQIRAQLLWNKLMIKKVRPRVKVTDEEIKLASQKFAAPAVKQELKIAAITLPVDKPSREAEIRKLADKLVGEVRGGASFEEVARQFSSSAPTTGGKIEAFWVRPEQIDPRLSSILKNATTGMITPPVRTEAGYSIVKVYDTRSLEQQPQKDVEVQLKQILLKLKPDAQQKEADVLLQIGEEVAKHPGTCEEKGFAGMENMKDFDIEVEFAREYMSELPGALKIIAENLKVGEISTPFASEQGIRLYMLCDRKEGVAKAVDQNRVGNVLFAQKMDLESQKYMRNLRRDAFIEIRQSTPSS